MTRDAMAALASRCCRIVVLATVALSPTQWGWATRPDGAHLSLADGLVGLAMLIWVAKIILLRDWFRNWRLPWTVYGFVFAALLSIFAAEYMGLALRDTAQVIEYFMVAYLLYDDLLHRHPRFLRVVLWLALGAMAVNLLLAAWQYGTVANPIRVRGAFGSRNVFAGWLALVLPVVCGVAVHTSSWRIRAGLGLVVLAGFWLDLSAPSFYTMLVVCLLLCATRGWRLFAAAVLLATIWLAALAPRIGAFTDAQTHDSVTHAQALFRSTALYAPDGRPERRYPEWQSAVEMMLSRPWLGEGIGNYQRHVGLYTGSKPSFTGPSEPDIQNLYLVIGSTMGLPALLFFVAMLIRPALQAGAASSLVSGWQKGLCQGVAGGLAAFACTAVWHPLLVRGIGLHLVLMLVLARHLAERAQAQAQAEAPEQEDLSRRGDSRTEGAAGETDDPTSVCRPVSRRNT